MRATLPGRLLVSNECRVESKEGRYAGSSNSISGEGDVSASVVAECCVPVVPVPGRSGEAEERAVSRGVGSFRNGCDGRARESNEPPRRISSDGLPSPISDIIIALDTPGRRESSDPRPSCWTGLENSDDGDDAWEKEARSPSFERFPPSMTWRRVRRDTSREEEEEEEEGFGVFASDRMRPENIFVARELSLLGE